MFRVEQNVPEVYVQQSRDFQLYSRLYDLVFQSARFSIDSMEQISDTMHCNDKLLPLIATKVGFFTDLNLTNYADRQVLSAFPYIIKYKGSLMGIQLVANLFQRIMNVNSFVEQDPVDNHRVVIKFEDYSPNVQLLYALLDYIRPTGVVVDYEIITKTPESATEFIITDNVTITDIYREPSEILKDEYYDYDSNLGFTQVSNKLKEDEKQ